MRVYVHYKNHKPYTKLSDKTTIQVEDKWVEAVLYCCQGDSSLKFVRSKAEFEEKFFPVDIVQLNFK